jgi:hypothetical protein
MGWMGDPLGDYLKFRGMTPLGILLYPILAPTLLVIALVITVKSWFEPNK